jgi:hypothetical protein
MLDDKAMKERLRKRIFLIRSFLHTISHRQGGGPEVVLQYAVAGYFIKSVILELIIKTLYESDRRCTAKKTHDILSIYNELGDESKKFLHQQFQESKDKLAQRFESIDETISFGTFEEVLASNEGIIKDFKYDGMASSTNSPIDGPFIGAALRHLEERMEAINE